MNIELTFAEMKYIDFVDLIIKIPDFDPEAEWKQPEFLYDNFFSILNSVRKTNTIVLRILLLG